MCAALPAIACVELSVVARTRRDLGRLLLLGVVAVLRYTVLSNQECALALLGVFELLHVMRLTRFVVDSSAFASVSVFWRMNRSS